MPRTLTEQFMHDRQLIDAFQLKKAQTAVKKTLRQTKKEFGETSIEYAYAFLNLGAWHFANSDYVAAETILKQSVQSFREFHDAIGGLQWILADALCVLGNAYHMQAKTDDATEAHAQAWDWLLESERHSVLAGQILIGQGINFMQQGEFEQALDKHEYAAGMLADCLGMKHILTGYAYTHVAAHYRQQGFHAEAHSMLRAIVQNTGDKHVYGAFAYRELAMVIDILGQHAEAANWFQAALKIAQETVGKMHTQYADVLLAYAMHSKHHGKVEEALVQLHEALSIYLSCFDEDHPAIHFATQHIVQLLVANTQREEDE